MKPEVLLIGPLLPHTMETLASQFNVHRYDTAKDKPSLLASLARHLTAIATRGDYDLPGSLLRQLPNVRIIASSGAGYDGIDTASASQLGMSVTNTPGVVSECVADLAWTLVLSTVRKTLMHDRFVRTKKWLTTKPALTDKVWGENLGIIGLGGIGKAVARRGEAFGMKISYCGRHKQIDVPYSYYSDPIELANKSKILIVCVPGAQSTKGIVSAQVIDALGPNGYLINVSRGSAVDEPYLIDALKQGRLAGAGLDVFANEPAVPDALIELENVVLQPHIGSGSNYTRNAMGQMLVDNLSAFFDGRPLLSPIGPRSA